MKLILKVKSGIPFCGQSFLYEMIPVEGPETKKGPKNHHPCHWPGDWVFRRLFGTLFGLEFGGLWEEQGRQPANPVSRRDFPTTPMMLLPLFSIYSSFLALVFESNLMETCNIDPFLALKYWIFFLPYFQKDYCINLKSGEE